MFGTIVLVNPLCDQLIGVAAVPMWQIVSGEDVGQVCVIFLECT